MLTWLCKVLATHIRTHVVTNASHLECQESLVKCCEPFASYLQTFCTVLYYWTSISDIFHRCKTTTEQKFSNTCSALNTGRLTYIHKDMVKSSSESWLFTILVPPLSCRRGWLPSWRQPLEATMRWAGSSSPRYVGTQLYRIHTWTSLQVLWPLYESLFLHTFVYTHSIYYLWVKLSELRTILQQGRLLSYTIHAYMNFKQIIQTRTTIFT